LQETPFSVSVLDQDFLEDLDAPELDESAQFVPGLQMGNQVNNIAQVFQSRGFQLGRDGILVNGTQQSDAFSIIPSGLVSAVESVRGPASILVGQSPPGGAINIVTKKPMNERFAEIHGRYDENKTRGGGIDLNTGELSVAGRPVYFRFNAGGENSSSFRDAVERDTYYIAPVVTSDLTDRTRLTLEANIIGWEATGDRGIPIFDAGTDQAADRFDRSAFLLGTTDKQNEREQYRLMLDLSHRAAEALTINYQFTYGKTDRTFFSIFPRAIDPQSGLLSRDHFGTEDEFESIDTRLDGEFAFDTGALRHNGIVAVQYRDFERTDKFTSFIAGADAVSLENPVNDAPFLADDGPAGGLQGDQTSLEWFLQDSVSVTSGPLAGLSALAGFRFISFEDDASAPEIDEEEFVSRFGLTYTPPIAPWLSVYGSYSESFNPQQATDSAGNALSPEEGEQWEAGAKMVLLEERLLITASYFDLENTNVAASDPDDPFSSIPIGTQENQGVELEAVGRISDRLQVKAQYTFNDSEVVKDPQRRGNELQLTPDNSGSIWLRYETRAFDNPLFPRLSDRLVLAGGAVFVGDRFATIDNQIELRDYTRVDAKARYEMGNGTSVSVKLHNLTGEKFFTGGNTFGGSVLPGQPFTVGVSFSHAF